MFNHNLSLHPPPGLSSALQRLGLMFQISGFATTRLDRSSKDDPWKVSALISALLELVLSILLLLGAAISFITTQFVRYFDLEPPCAYIGCSHPHAYNFTRGTDLNGLHSETKKEDYYRNGRRYRELQVHALSSEDSDGCCNGRSSDGCCNGGPSHLLGTDGSSSKDHHDAAHNMGVCFPHFTFSGGHSHTTSVAALTCVICNTPLHRRLHSLDKHSEYKADSARLFEDGNLPLFSGMSPLSDGSYSTWENHSEVYADDTSEYLSDNQVASTDTEEESSFISQDKSQLQVTVDDEIASPVTNHGTDSVNFKTREDKSNSTQEPKQAKQPMILSGDGHDLATTSLSDFELEGNASQLLLQTPVHEEADGWSCDISQESDLLEDQALHDARVPEDNNEKTVSGQMQEEAIDRMIARDAAHNHCMSNTHVTLSRSGLFVNLAQNNQASEAQERQEVEIELENGTSSPTCRNHDGEAKEESVAKLVATATNIRESVSAHEALMEQPLDTLISFEHELNMEQQSTGHMARESMFTTFIETAYVIGGSQSFSASTSKEVSNAFIDQSTPTCDSNHESIPTKDLKGDSGIDIQDSVFAAEGMQEEKEDEVVSERVVDLLCDKDKRIFDLEICMWKGTTSKLEETEDSASDDCQNGPSYNADVILQERHVPAVRREDDSSEQRTQEECLDALKEALRADRHVLDMLEAELEKERNAAEIAASEAMAMISRLQEEKSAMQMEVAQLQRMSEEKAEYDQQAMELLKEILFKREREKYALEKEVELYRERFLTQEESKKAEGDGVLPSIQWLKPSLALQGVEMKNMEIVSSDVQDQSPAETDLFDLCVTTRGLTSVGSAREKASKRPGTTLQPSFRTCLSPPEHVHKSHQESSPLDRSAFSPDDEETEFILERLCVLEEELRGLRHNEEFEQGTTNESRKRGKEESELELEGANEGNLQVHDVYEVQTASSEQREFPCNLDEPEHLDLSKEQLCMDHQSGWIVEAEVSRGKAALQMRTLPVREERLAMEELQELPLRLKALEGDRELLRQALESFKQKDTEINLLQEIAQHLRELRMAGIRVVGTESLSKDQAPPSPEKKALYARKKRRYCNSPVPTEQLPSSHLPPP